MSAPNVLVDVVRKERAAISGRVDSWTVVAEDKAADVEWLHREITKACQQLADIDAWLTENAPAETVTS